MICPFDASSLTLLNHVNLWFAVNLTHVLLTNVMFFLLHRIYTIAMVGQEYSSLIMCMCKITFVFLADLQNHLKTRGDLNVHMNLIIVRQRLGICQSAAKLSIVEWEHVQFVLQDSETLSSKHGARISVILLEGRLLSYQY
jgi:hypothetical protein